MEFLCNALSIKARLKEEMRTWTANYTFSNKQCMWHIVHRNWVNYQQLLSSPMGSPAGDVWLANRLGLLGLWHWPNHPLQPTTLSIQMTEEKIELTTLIILEKLRLISLGNTFNQFLIYSCKLKDESTKKLNIVCILIVKIIAYMQICTQLFSLVVIVKCTLLLWTFDKYALV